MRVDCFECGKKIGADSAKCPFCGHQEEYGFSWLVSMLELLALVLGFLAVFKPDILRLL